MLSLGQQIYIFTVCSPLRGLRTVRLSPSFMSLPMEWVGSMDITLQINSNLWGHNPRNPSRYICIFCTGSGCAKILPCYEMFSKCIKYIFGYPLFYIDSCFHLEFIRQFSNKKCTHCKLEALSKTIQLNLSIF